MSYRLGVDVGGTFTDLLLVNEKTGELQTAKVPSTPEDSSIGVFNGINKVCANANIDPSKITSVMHGTTVATNTILEGSGVFVKKINKFIKPVHGFNVVATANTCLLYTSPSPRD